VPHPHLAWAGRWKVDIDPLDHVWRANCFDLCAAFHVAYTFFDFTPDIIS
jgi:hypothetical protein